LRDLIEVGVVLGVVASGIAEVPEQVRAQEVTAESPHTAVGIGGQQAVCALADLVDVVHLPRRVMEERHRRDDQADVVMIVGTPKEGDDAGRGVAELEPQHVHEEVLAGLEIGRAVQHVSEAAGARRARIEDGRGAAVAAHVGARRVHDR
jgi:hypothetical protein